MVYQVMYKILKLLPSKIRIFSCINYRIIEHSHIVVVHKKLGLIASFHLYVLVYKSRGRACPLNLGRDP